MHCWDALNDTPCGQRGRPAGRIVRSPHCPAGVSLVIKPRTPPGIMELLPREQIAFQRMLDVIRRN
ncbi:histidine--tRNA ligase, partial [Xanthomonas perforans]|nr:histidine--tRNA ligase [Xanthomonas perforans]